MHQPVDLEKLFEELSGHRYDIRAEALMGQVVQQAGAGDIVAINDGRFFREYRKDLYAVDRIEDSWKQQLLQLHLSRTGLYDLLPEGLFHQSVGENNRNDAATAMAAYSRRDKKKEGAARKFFQPVENSFFWQRVQLEREEEQLLAGIDSGMLTDYFFRFWGFPEGLNKNSGVLLVLLLPYAHVIAGNLDLMQSSLSILLQEKVNIRQVAPSLSYADEQDGGLGNLALGNDMVCGNHFWEDHTCLQYDIGPLQNSFPSEYVQGGENDILLEVFNNYFAPVEADITINIEVDREKALIRLDDEHSPILGYSSML
jgi:hypothetical protein